MALQITAAELAVLNSVLTKTRQALIEGTIGGAAIPGVVSAADFDGTPAVADGVKLTTIGLVQALENGLILKSPNGTYYKLTVSDAGAAVFTAI